MVVGGHVVEQEVLVPEFVGFGVADEVLVAGSETVVLAGQAELLEHVDHGVFELESLLLVHGGWQVESLDVPGDSGSHGNFFETRVDFGKHILADGNIPVVGLFCLALDFVVLSDEWF